MTSLPYTAPAGLPDTPEAVAPFAWAMLARAARDRRHAMHTLVLASVRDQRPEARIVVLRHTDTAARTLRIHTDSRSAKLDDFADNAAAAVVAYDPVAKIQLRLTATARLHIGDETARLAWNGSRDFSLVCYHQAEPPGMALDAPRPAPRPQDFRAPAAAINFAVITLHVTELDWLYLDAAGHRRAHVAWHADGTETSTWIAP